MRKKTNAKIDYIVYNIITITVVVTLLLAEWALDFRSNIKAADRTQQLLIEEVKNVLDNDENETEILTESCKEDYITRARAISYIIEHQEALERNIAELKRIAHMMNVDEINLFDTEGVIYFGTNTDYYGVSMDDGEQIGFFKPMLDDDRLSLCQDMVPNTALGIEMMYACVWREDNKGLVQIGIEPERLVSEMKKSSINELIADMPMTEGINIYVADVEDGTIYGSTDTKVVGMTLGDIGIDKSTGQWDVINTIKIDGKRYRLIFTQYDGYAIGIVYDMDDIQQGTLFNLTIVSIYLIVSAAIIYYILYRLRVNRERAEDEIRKSAEERDRQLEVLTSMSEMYTSMHLIDLVKGSWIEYSATEDVRVNYSNKDIDDLATMVTKTTAYNAGDDYREDMIEFTDIHTIRKRMQNVKSMYRDFIGLHGKWSRCTFITIKKDEEGYPISVILAVQPIDEEKRREEGLIYKSNTDELTGLSNRRAYEEHVEMLMSDPLPEDFVVMSMDVNGLKNVNDTLGHSAGDELIRSSAKLLEANFGGFGIIYRVGGDEFAALLDVSEEELKRAIDEFNSSADLFTGELVNSLAVSIGYARHADLPEADLTALGKKADEMMYKNKADYYSSKGIDRRGRASAYKAICNSYIKILKVDLKTDTYQIIKMNEEEKTETMGYGESISGWLHGFGESGQVHKDDIGEYFEKTDLDYIKNYFVEGAKILSIYYRRHVGNDFRRVIMEMVPTENYSESEPTLYLYVKELN